MTDTLENRSALKTGTVRGLGCLLALMLSATATQAEVPALNTEQRIVLTRGLEPVPTHQVAPDYPFSARRFNAEAWVLVLMDVDEQGRVVDPLVLDSSYGGSLAEAFRDATVEAVSQWQFKPATVDGKPVYRSNVNRMFIFKFEDSGGEVTSRFYNGYRKTARALDSGDLETARKLLDKMRDRNKYVLAEHTYYRMLETFYLAEAGDDQATLKQLEETLQLADNAAQENAYAQLLRMSVVRHANDNQLHRALGSYATLQELGSGLSDDDPVHANAAEVRAALESDQPIVTEGAITACESCRTEAWFFTRPLNRQRFSVQLEQGEIDSINVVCGPARISLAWSENTVYTLDNNAADCTIAVKGSPASLIRLVELS